VIRSSGSPQTSFVVPDGRLKADIALGKKKNMKMYRTTADIQPIVAENE
jgi:hypothetical protein